MSTLQADYGTASRTNTKIRFSPNTDFERELRKRVSMYFGENDLSSKDNAHMYLKSAISVAWVAASYALLVFAGLPIWGLFLAVLSLSVALNALSFNVMHDALHGAYSERTWINKGHGHVPGPHRRELVPLVQEAQLLSSLVPQHRGTRRRHRGRRYSRG